MDLQLKNIDMMTSSKICHFYPKNVIVVGYYDHYNLGDEQYKVTIKHILNIIFCRVGNDVPIHFLNCDMIMSYKEEFTQDTLVVLGGGDILNHYFLDKLNHFIRDLSFLPRIIAISVGIPYNDIFLKKEHIWKLSILEHIFLRTTKDITNLENHLAYHNINTRVHFLPDVSCIIEDVMSINKDTLPLPEYITSAIIENTVQHKRRIIGIILSRHVYSKLEKNQENYKRIIRKYIQLIVEFISRNFYIIFVPFNTKPLYNMSRDNNQENDLLMQEDIYEKLNENSRKYVLNVKESLDCFQMMKLFKSFYLTIPMRYHATLFSIYAQIPMIPIFTTKKIYNLLSDNDWNYYCMMNKNSDDVPYDMDVYTIFNSFYQIISTKNYKCAKEKLYTIGQYMKSTLYKKINMLQDTIHDSRPISTSVIDQEPNLDTSIHVRFTDEITEINANVEDQENTQPEVDLSQIHDLYEKLNKFAKDHSFHSFTNICDSSLKHVAVSIVNYHFTGNLDSPYSDGLFEKMFDPSYNYIEEWKWIMKDIESQQTTTDDGKPVDQEIEETISLDENVSYPPILTAYTTKTALNIDIPKPIEQNTHEPVFCADNAFDSTRKYLPSWPIQVPSFNIDYMNQNDESGVHRSGWKYVYDHIKTYNDPNSNTLLDLYVDRTFHWNREVLKYHGVIPYKKPWYGFIHHTFDISFSEYNNYTLLDCPEFLESLHTCKGLIVLSDTLQQQFINVISLNRNLQAKLRHLNITNPIKIFKMTHPTDMQKIPLFDFSLFKNNPNKKIIHIGGWLRNIFSFYQLNEIAPYLCDSVNELPKNMSFLQKLKCNLCKCFTKSHISTSKHNPIKCAILKGKNMNNYFPNKEHLQLFNDMISHSSKYSYKKNDFDSFISATHGLSFASIGNIQEGEAMIKNNWFKHMFEYINSLTNNPNIEIIDYVDNHTYDNLFVNNIVFINLVDGSAINTLIECFVRNTPIVINPHPVVVEVLGKDYPLYYNSIYEIPSLLTIRSIEQAHIYMKNMSKKSYHIDTFCQRLFKILHLE